jgi:predicted AlkP superfamily pyrophosphatase or phosphodiesterase
MKMPGALASFGAILVIASLVLPAAQRRPARADHLLLVGVDGLGSEGLRVARAPAIRALIDAGAHTLAARGVMPTVSSPNWASMISGAGPEQHGVTSNDWEPSPPPD